MNSDVCKKVSKNTPEQLEKRKEGLRRAHAEGRYKQAQLLQREKIKLAWLNGKYSNRDLSYKDNVDHIARKREEMRSRWCNGFYTEERNKKISAAHKGKPKPWLQKEPYIKICEWCTREFKTKKKKQRFCDRKCSSKYIIKNRTTAPEVERARREKLSIALKGKIPKNLKTRIAANNSYKQHDMFLVIKQFFPDAIANYYVKTKITKRWLDVAVPSLFLDFEYDGKVHLMKNVQENDRKRTRELEELGWTVIRFNRTNYHTINDILTNLKKNIKNCLI